MFTTNLDYKKVYESLSDGLEQYVESSKIKSLIIGISGGIDSTVVAAIADEVGKRIFDKTKDFNIVGVTLPTSTTNSEEKKVADKVMDAFTNVRVGLNIDRIFERFRNEIWGASSDFDLFFKNDGLEKIQLRKGNIKSRIRMILLYDAAKAHDGIVLGTDNYSEYLLGFSTIGGDALFDYCPIQYLWKTEVYGLANYILDKYNEENREESRRKAKALEESIKLTPMDGLGISNNDMDQIGAKDYFEVDNILQNFEKGTLDAIKDEVSEETIENVLNRNRWTEYKRNHPIRVKRETYDK